MLRVAGAGDDTHSFLQIPPKNHLSHRFSMCCCNLPQYGIIQHLSGVTPPAKRIPTLNGYPFILNIFHRRAVLIVWVDLILNQSRFYGNLRQKRIRLTDVVVDCQVKLTHFFVESCPP